MIIGITRLKDWATAGGTESGILMHSFLFLAIFGISSPTSSPTINATKSPWAPINVIGRAFPTSLAT